MKKTVVTIVKAMVMVALFVAIGRTFEWVLDATDYSVIYDYSVTELAFEAFVYGSIGYVLFKFARKVAKGISGVMKRFEEWAISEKQNKAA